MILEYKQCLRIQDTITYPYSLSVKIITKYQTKTIRTNWDIYHICNPNNFLDVRNLYQDRASTDMTLDEVKNLTSTC